VILASTIDEEHGVGNGLLLLHLAGVQAEAALYLDGGAYEHWLGNCGGSNFLLHPRGVPDRPALERDAAALRVMAADWNVERAELFDQPYFRANMRRATSIDAAVRDDACGPVLKLFFYTVPGESREAFSAALEARVAAALGARLAAYHQSYRQPWFEPALADPATPFFAQMALAHQEIMGVPPRVGTVSKQDAFVLQNHAGIPTLSFGVSRLAGRGAFHQPDEFVADEDAWQGAQIASRALERWLEAGQ
jgi:hypothetical protein